MISEQQALDLASESARRAGWRLEDYESPQARLDNDHLWVFYRGVSGLPGDHFSVTVDLQSEKTRVVAGR